MVQTVIYAAPYPRTRAPRPEATSGCLAMLLRQDGKVPYGCTRERGHDPFRHQAVDADGLLLAEWSDE